MQHKLTSKQRRAIYLLARGMSNNDVVKALKIRRETLWRWKKLPEFAKNFEHVMEELRTGMQHRLSYMIDASITAVQSELAYPSDPKRIQTALNVIKLLGISHILYRNDAKTPPNDAPC